MSPNSHPSKAGSVVESDVSYNSIVKGWQTTGDQVTTSGLESVRVMIRRGIHLFNSDADHRRFFIYSFQLNYRHRVNHRGTGTARPFVLVINMAKEFARSFYSSKAWQDCRNEYAKRRHHLCEDCLRRGIYKPGVIVHHIEELTPFNITNPEIALGFDNLELLCRECHLREHDLEGGRWAKVNAAKRKDKRESRRFSVDEFGKVAARSPHAK